MYATQNPSGRNVKSPDEDRRREITPLIAATKLARLQGSAFTPLGPKKDSNFMYNLASQARRWASNKSNC